MERNLTFIQVERERTHFNRFFNANCVEYHVLIKDPDAVDVPFTTIDEWFLNVFAELLEFGLRHAEPWHYVGVRISISDLETRPIGLSFRPIHSLTSEMIVDVLTGVIQSNDDFGIASRLEVSMTIVRVPDGGRPTPLHKLNKNNLLANKKRCIVVPRGLRLQDVASNSCLPDALIIGRALADNADKTYINSLIRRNSRVLRIERNKLLRKAKVQIDVEVGCVLSDVVKFAQALKNYEITIFDSFTSAKSILFQSQKRNLKIYLFYLSEERHFITISRLPGFFGYSYFCEYCDVMYQNFNKHKCLAMCPFCRQLGVCPPVTNLIKCQTCHRSFRGDRCLANHFNFPCEEVKKRSNSVNPDRNTVCQQLQICPNCFYFVDYRRIKEHNCTDRYCTVCRKIVEESHLCYMQKYTKEAPKKYAIIFYDFETTAEVKYLDRDDEFEHRPNLCVASQICHRCHLNESDEPDCINCTPRTRVFEGLDCVKQFIGFVDNYRKFCANHVTCIAHNARGFDMNFIITELLERDRSLKIILGGRKFLYCLYNGCVRFIDSFSFIPSKLEDFIRCFDLNPDFSKYKFFPYRFNTQDNYNYEGTVPDERFYGIENFTEKKKEEFHHWRNDLLDRNYVFNMRQELIDYCKADVKLLRLGFMRFCHSFYEMTSIHCALESFTLAQSVLYTYCKNFLKPNFIGLVPTNKYKSRQNQSLIARKWLLYQQSLQPYGKIEFEAFAPNTRISVDGINRARNNLLFEFLGCYYHAHEKCILSTGGYRKDSRVAEFGFFERRDRTRFKMQRLKDLNFNVVSTYECEFVDFLKKNKDIEKQLNEHPDLGVGDLEPRDCLRGGRVECFKMLVECTDEQRLRYVDIVSLYPFVCLRATYCVGHPKIYRGVRECSQAPNIFEMEGIIRCRVLPPRDLYIPVLPYFYNKRLYFPLCGACTRDLQITPCEHNNLERSLIGTWTIYEVKVSLLKGYEMIEVYEIWSYDISPYNEETKTNQVFSEYIRTFAKIKMEASGYPPGVETEKQKDEYIKDVEIRDNIKLDKNKIIKNSSFRQVSKLILNTIWGKVSQRGEEGRTKTSVIRKRKELYDLLFSDVVEVVDLYFPNTDTAFVQWKIKKDAIDVSPPQNKSISVILGAYTTAVARQVLRAELEKLNEAVAYIDTDSIVLIAESNSSYIPTLGGSFGAYTDEIRAYGPEAIMTKFCSLGPKAYSFVVKKSPESEEEVQVCKFKGMSMKSSDTRSKLSYENMKAMLVDPSFESIETITPVISRVKYFKLVNQNQKKSFKYTYDKRVLLEGYDTLPYGHEGIRRYN